MLWEHLHRHLVVPEEKTTEFFLDRFFFQKNIFLGDENDEIVFYKVFLGGTHDDFEDLRIQNEEIISRIFFLGFSAFSHPSFFFKSLFGSVDFQVCQDPEMPKSFLEMYPELCLRGLKEMVPLGERGGGGGSFFFFLN